MKQRLFLAALLISLLIHTMTGISIWSLGKFSKPLSEAPVEVQIVTTQPTKKEDNVEDKIKGQIVEQNEKPVNDETPKDSKYLSQFNQRVEKETRAADVGQFNNDAGSGSEGKKKSAASTSASAPKAKLQASKNQITPSKSTSDGLPTLDSLKPQFSWSKSASASEPQEASEGGGRKSATNDYLKDTASGIQTMLNTREFIYYSYYKRIKNQIGQYWEPKIKDKVMHMFRRGRQLASDKERVTKLLIILNNKGTLIGVKVLGQSGVEDLDQAAIEAFREAAPFPNPPQGIVETDGTIKIRWDFILEA